jgi:hypothetical protein
VGSVRAEEMRIRTISLDLLGQFLGLSELTFGLEPELFIPSEGKAPMASTFTPELKFSVHTG